MVNIPLWVGAERGLLLLEPFAHQDKERVAAFGDIVGQRYCCVGAV